MLSLTNRTILAISPHIDDVELGAGGTLHALAERNAVHYVGLSVPPDVERNVFLAEFHESARILGLDTARISTEAFGPGPALTPGIAPGPVIPPHAPAGDPGQGPDVTFSRSGPTVPWRDGVTSLLELAEACDVPTRWSCRTGICHSCVTGILAGTVSYDPAPVDLPADGTVLVCCSAPGTDVVIDL